jgi:hypothetical protein
VFDKLGQQLALALRYRRHQAKEGLLERDDGSVSVFPMYGYSEDAIDALESALEESFGNVEVARDVHPGAGAAEIFFVIQVAVGAGGAIYAKKFLETLASEHAKALNAAIVSALKKWRDRQGRIRTDALRIDVGGIRLYFRHLDNGAVLRERAQAALPLLEASVDTAPERTPARVRSDGVALPAIEGCGYYWDVPSSSWQRAPVDWVGEVCPPDAG